MLNTRCSVDSRFDNTGDAGINHIRVGTAQNGVDHNHGEINRWNTVDADALVGD